MPAIARRYYFTGRVQAVGFRYQTSSLAADFPVCGFVQNLADGRVELHSEGEEQILAAFVRAIQDKFAGYIQSVEIQDVAMLQLKGFEIRR